MFLNSLSESGRSGFEIYSKYFKTFCLTENDISLVAVHRSATIETVMLNKQYSSASEETDPAFFSFFSHYDVERVAKLCNLEIVIYVGPTPQTSSHKLSVMHDFRTLRSNAAQRQKTVYYFYAYQSLKLYTLETQPQNVVSPPFAIRTGQTSSDDDEVNYARLVEDVLFEASEHDVDADIALPVIRQPSDLEECSDVLYRRWKGSKTVVIVSMCRLLIHTKWNYRRKFSDYYFATLAAILPGLDGGGFRATALGTCTPTPEVVCIWNNNVVVKLNSAFAEQILLRHFDSTGYKEHRGTKVGLTGVKFFSEEERLAAKQAWLKKKYGKRKATSQISEKRKCCCSMCTESATKYIDNMNSDGPERLCTVPYNISDLLRLLNLYDDDAQADLERLCELTIAAMDIESKTVTLDIGGPLAGEKVQYDEIDSSRLEGYSKKSQQPIMIAHVDARSLPDARKVFTVANDLPEAAFQMMKEYWSYVLESQRVVQDEKHRIASKYYSIINMYRSAFFETANSWFGRIADEYQQQKNEVLNGDLDFKEDGDARHDHQMEMLDELHEKFEYNSLRVEAAWRATLPGQLERALDRIVEQYEIFSFYG